MPSKCDHVDRYASGRCKPCARKRALKWQKENPHRIKLRKQKCAGLPVAERPEPNFCEACGMPETKIHPVAGKVQSLCLDHCHETGRFRGWLCDSCNRALGILNDDVNRVLALKRYLETNG